MERFNNQDVCGNESNIPLGDCTDYLYSAALSLRQFSNNARIITATERIISVTKTENYTDVTLSFIIQEITVEKEVRGTIRITKDSNFQIVEVDTFLKKHSN